jgi:hypothetical protein
MLFMGPKISYKITCKSIIKNGSVIKCCGKTWAVKLAKYFENIQV